VVGEISSASARVTEDAGDAGDGRAMTLDLEERVSVNHGGRGPAEMPARSSRLTATRRADTRFDAGAVADMLRRIRQPVVTGRRRA